MYITAKMVNCIFYTTSFLFSITPIKKNETKLPLNLKPKQTQIKQNDIFY